MKWGSCLRHLTCLCHLPCRRIPGWVCRIFLLCAEYILSMHNRPRSFLETGFRPLYPSFVWFAPLSRTKRVFWISTTKPNFEWAGVDTSWRVRHPPYSLKLFVQICWVCRICVEYLRLHELEKVSTRCEHHRQQSDMKWGSCLFHLTSVRAYSLWMCIMRIECA